MIDYIKRFASAAAFRRNLPNAVPFGFLEDINALAVRISQSGTVQKLAAFDTSVSGDPVKYVEVSLTNAQLLAIRATPIQIIPAPGANKIAQLLFAQFIGQFTGAYTETADNLVFRYLDGTGIIVSETVEMTGFIDQTGGIRTTARGKIDAIATTAQADNRAIVLHNSGDGEFGGGNAANTLKIRAFYSIHGI